MEGHKLGVGTWAEPIVPGEMIERFEFDQYGFKLIRPSSALTVFADKRDVRCACRSGRCA